MENSILILFFCLFCLLITCFIFLWMFNKIEKELRFIKRELEKTKKELVKSGIFSSYYSYGELGDVLSIEADNGYKCLHEKILKLNKRITKRRPITTTRKSPITVIQRLKYKISILLRVSDKAQINYEMCIRLIYSVTLLASPIKD